MQQYFAEILPAVKTDKKFDVNLIIETLNDIETFKLFKFYEPIISLLQSENEMFQAEYFDPLSAIEELEMLKNTFKSDFLIIVEIEKIWETLISALKPCS